MTEFKNKPADIATRIMAAMVKMPPEPHKAAPKANSKRADAQRLRRERERQRPTSATCGD